MVYNYYGDYMYFLFDSIYNYTSLDYLNFYNKLCYDDKCKYNSLIKDNDKKLYLLSRMLLSKLSYKYFKINYFDLNIRYNSYGKPYVDNYYFNIAHSYEYAVVVISNKEIGVDIEKIRDVDLKMIDYFCNDKEREYILNSKDVNKSFLEIFCLKEAYFKMKGSTILKFRDIGFNVKNNTFYCINDDKINIIVKYMNNYIITIIEDNY